MDRIRTGFGTRTGFELAAIGSTVGLGNIWGFPYKTSANGGAAYLFVYLLCILLVGAFAMLAEFSVGRRGMSNPVTAYKSFSLSWGAVGLLAVLVPALITCYYYVLGGYTVKYALSSFTGNIGIFNSFAANTGDVLLHTVIFAALALAVVSAGVRGGIETAAKILLPSMALLLIVISCFTLSLGDGVREGLLFYLRPDFKAISRAGVLSAMGQAFFSLSLGCGAMITYGSYAGKKVNLFRSTAMICLLDVLITFLAGLAIFPALFHYAAVTGTPASELGMGGIGLIFITLPHVFGEMPVVGQLVSLLFFAMTAIAALTSVVSIVEVVTQFIIQCYRLCRTRAAILVTCVCLACAVPVAVSMGSSLNGGTLLCLFGRNLLEILDGVTNTVLMPICALCACFAVGWRSGQALPDTGGCPRTLVFGEESPLLRRFSSIMLRFVSPLLIVVIESFGIADLVSSPGGTGTLLCACTLLVLTAACYFAFYRNRDTGSNRDEAVLQEQAMERRNAGLQRGWYPEKDR